MIRGIVNSITDGLVRLFSASGRPGESFDNREFIQDYGFASSPKKGAELVILAQGNTIVAIGSDDRRYRIRLEEGECALYDDLGQKVHLTRAGIIATSPKKITATAPTVEIVATVKVKLTTPLLEVSGGIRAGGDVSDKKGSMQQMRGIHNGHLHPDPQGGNTGKTPAVM